MGRSRNTHIRLRRERPASALTLFGFGPRPVRPSAVRSLAVLERAHVANSPVRTSVALSDVLDVRIGLQTEGEKSNNGAIDQ